MTTATLEKKVSRSGVVLRDAQTGIEVKIPVGPKKLTGYQAYMKSEHQTIASENPSLSQQELIGLVGTRWKSLASNEKDAYERLADRDHRKQLEDWEDRKHEREFDRMSAARGLKLSPSATWEEIVEAVKRRNSGDYSSNFVKNNAAQASSSTSSGKRDIRQRSEDWEACWRSTVRRKAVVKALDAIFAMADEEENFQAFGNDMIQCFYDIASVTTDPVRGRALMYVEQLAQRWRHAVLSRGWRTPGTKPSPQKILDTIVGLYCMERVGVCSARLKADVCDVVANKISVQKESSKGMSDLPAPASSENVKFSDEEEVAAAVADVVARVEGGRHSEEEDSASAAPAKQEESKEHVAAYSTADYLGWDPHSGGPPVGGEDVLSGESTTKYRSMCNALIYSFYAERVGVDIGCSYADVLRRLEELRPYKGPREIEDWDEFVDQCYLVTHVVFTMNNWGELALEPEIMPHEYSFIREHMCIAIRQRDVHLVGEYVECLRCFGASDGDPLVQLGIAFLLGTQSEESGRWDADQDAYTSYHATMVAAQALLAHTFRGYGPGLASALPVLEHFLNTDRHVIAAKTAPVLPPSPPPPPTSPTASSTPSTAKKGLPKTDDSEQQRPTTKEAPPAQKQPSSKKVAPPSKRQKIDLHVDLPSLEASLQRAASKSDWPLVAGLLGRLGAADVKLNDLTQTSLGKTVAQLKKAEDTGVSAAAKALVAKWKKLVRGNS